MCSLASLTRSDQFWGNNDSLESQHEERTAVHSLASSSAWQQASQRGAVSCPMAHPRSSRGGRAPAGSPLGSGWWPPAPGPCSAGQLPSAAEPGHCCCSAGWLWLPSIRHGSIFCCRNCDTYRKRRGIVNTHSLWCLCVVTGVLNFLHLKLRKRSSEIKKTPNYLYINTNIKTVTI